MIGDKVPEPGLDEAPALQLRPFYLPPTGHAFDPAADEIPEGGPLDRHTSEYHVFGVHPVEEERLFWYRWITGHQISFAVWRAMHDVIRQCPDDVPEPGDIDLLTSCIDAYSAVLIYSSTVPRHHYHSHVRRRMALQHPAFSGTWAPDYRPVRRIFRGKIPWQDDASCAPFRDAVARNAATHDYIAEHLVPDGRSLLQQSVRTPGVTVSRDKEELYDNLFLTVRRPVRRDQFIGQLEALIAGVATDLARNGLYPNVGGHHHPVVTGPSGGLMMTLVTCVVDVLDEAARRVTEMHLQGVGA